MKKTPKQKLRFFTLIELLVVIAIIGILASLLMPSLEKARKKAYVAVCLSNLSNVGKALQMYTSQNNGNFPTLKVFSDASTKVIWMGKTGSSFTGEDLYSIENRALNTYLGDFEEGDELPVAKCPEGVERYDEKGTSYRANNGTQWESLSKTWEKPVKVMEVKSPSKMIAFSEFAVYRVVKGSSVNEKDMNHTYTGQNKWTNLFVDGHCKFIKIHEGAINSNEYIHEYFQE